VFVGAQKNYEKCPQKGKRKEKKEERKERFQCSPASKIPQKISQ
jgi:hypothetical protein